MGASYLDLYMELVGVFPDLPVEQAKRFINRAQREAFDAWAWSFMLGDSNLDIPAAVNAGTITVVNNSNTFVGNATAAAAWQAIDLFIPITQRSIKIGTDFPYNILAFNGVDTVVVDRPYTGTNTSTTYSMYRIYYEPPDVDFGRWISIVDPLNSWNLITGKKKEWLDFIDPQRSNTGGPAQFVAFYKQRLAQTVVMPDGTEFQVQPSPLWELWPAPTSTNSLQVYFKRRGADLVNDTDTSYFDDQVLISKALRHCYRFVQVNMVKFPQVKGQKVDWNGLWKSASMEYNEALSLMIKRDDSVSLASIIRPQGNWYPSSSWLQKHLTFAEYSRAYAGSY